MTEWHPPATFAEYFKSYFNICVVSNYSYSYSCMQIVVDFRPGFMPFTCIMFFSMLFTHRWCVFYDTPMRLPVLQHTASTECSLQKVPSKMYLKAHIPDTNLSTSQIHGHTLHKGHKLGYIESTLWPFGMTTLDANHCSYCCETARVNIWIKKDH